MNDLHTQLGCLGYYGFGSGYDCARRDCDNEEPRAYCGAKCPLTNDCWKRHVERTRALFPVLCADFARLEQTSQSVAAQAFQIAHGRPNPYTTLLMGNIEDGQRVALGGYPLWRGDCTLPWPMKEN